jgi:hypothetical protein
VRPAEDVAYSIARWTAKGGSFSNYGLTGAALVTTKYVYLSLPLHFTHQQWIVVMQMMSC